MNFTNSPSEILFINLCPLNKDNHIKNICLYNFMITHSSKSKLKEYLIRLKKFENDKDKFNNLMNLFFELIEIYTGGHPRMVARLLKYFDKQT